MAANSSNNRATLQTLPPALMEAAEGWDGEAQETLGYCYLQGKLSNETPSLPYSGSARPLIRAVALVGWLCATPWVSASPRTCVAP
jgi:hypothetical protein